MWVSWRKRWICWIISSATCFLRGYIWYQTRGLLYSKSWGECIYIYIYIHNIFLRYIYVYIYRCLFIYGKGGLKWVNGWSRTTAIGYFASRVVTCSLWTLKLKQTSSAKLKQNLMPEKSVLAGFRSDPSVHTWVTQNHQTHGTRAEKSLEWLISQQLKRFYAVTPPKMNIACNGWKTILSFWGW